MDETILTDNLSPTIAFLERRLSGAEYCKLIGAKHRNASYSRAGSTVREAIRLGQIKLIRIVVEPEVNK